MHLLGLNTSYDLDGSNNFMRTMYEDKPDYIYKLGLLFSLYFNIHLMDTRLGVTFLI